MALAYRDPNNPAAPIFWTSPSGPAPPAGYVFCYSDGAYPVPDQTSVAGVNSGGYQQYTGDQSQLNAQPNWPNGILAGTVGNRLDGGH